MPDHRSPWMRAGGAPSATRPGSRSHSDRRDRLRPTTAHPPRVAAGRGAAGGALRRTRPTRWKCHCPAASIRDRSSRESRRPGRHGGAARPGRGREPHRLGSLGGGQVSMTMRAARRRTAPRRPRPRHGQAEAAAAARATGGLAHEQVPAGSLRSTSRRTRPGWFEPDRLVDPPPATGVTRFTRRSRRPRPPASGASRKAATGSSTGGASAEAGKDPLGERLLRCRGTKWRRGKAHSSHGPCARLRPPRSGSRPRAPRPRPAPSASPAGAAFRCSARSRAGASGARGSEGAA